MNETLEFIEQRNGIKLNAAIRTEVRTVTPEQAKLWLTVNTINRKPSQLIVDFYADQMKSGKWALTGEPIIFSDTKKLINGQHRLMAQIKADVVVQYLVVYNISEENYSKMDQPKVRTAADVCQAAGINNYSNIASGLNKYLSLEKNVMFKMSASQSATYYGVRGRAATKTSADDIKRTYYESPDLWQEINIFANRFYSKFSAIAKSDYFAYMAFLTLNKKHPKDYVISFFEMISRGTNVDNSTILVLREKLFQNKLSKYKMMGNARHAIIVKTWNCYVTGKIMKVLSYNPDNETAPQFI